MHARCGIISCEAGAVVNGVLIRRIFPALSWLALCGLLLATVLAQFGSFSWLAELATHFRIQYVGVALLLVAGFAGLRRLPPALLAAGLAMFNAWCAAPYLFPGQRPTGMTAGGPPQLVALNLYYRNQAYGTVRDYLRGRDPDVLVLSELTPAWAHELDTVIASYPFQVSRDRYGPWGLGIFSRYPLRDARALNLGVPGTVNVRAILGLPGRELELVAVHLSSPTSAVHAAQRNQQLAELAQVLGPSRAAPALPRLLVGDMNLTPFSPYFRTLLARTGLRDARQRAGFLGTWPTWLPLLQIPIDHCLADPALEVVGVDRGPAVGSDHYPLEVTLRRER
ncbi:MAG: endonuclease/exonuclease/phosphatase family protein [Gammaproteobacteria bacterium]